MFPCLVLPGLSKQARQRACRFHSAGFNMVGQEISIPLKPCYCFFLKIGPVCLTAIWNSEGKTRGVDNFFHLLHITHADNFRLFPSSGDPARWCAVFAARPLRGHFRKFVIEDNDCLLFPHHQKIIDAQCFVCKWFEVFVCAGMQYPLTKRQAE